MTRRLLEPALVHWRLMLPLAIVAAGLIAWGLMGDPGPFSGNLLAEGAGVAVGAILTVGYVDWALARERRRRALRELDARVARAYLDIVAVSGVPQPTESQDGEDVGIADLREAYRTLHDKGSFARQRAVDEGLGPGIGRSVEAIRQEILPRLVDSVGVLLAMEQSLLFWESEWRTSVDVQAGDEGVADGGEMPEYVLGLLYRLKHVRLMVDDRSMCGRRPTTRPIFRDTVRDRDDAMRAQMEQWVGGVLDGIAPADELTTTRQELNARCGELAELLAQRVRPSEETKQAIDALSRDIAVIELGALARKWHATRGEDDVIGAVDRALVLVATLAAGTPYEEHDRAFRARAGSARVEAARGEIVRLTEVTLEMVPDGADSVAGRLTDLWTAVDDWVDRRRGTVTFDVPARD